MIYVANAVQSPNAQDPTDTAHPEWDTMIALRNLDTVPVTAKITLIDDNGFIVKWPSSTPNHLDHDNCYVTIQPGLMWAASFIPGNGFTLPEGSDSFPPQNWRGAATIDCTRYTPFGLQDATQSIAPFFLLAFNHWHNGLNAPYRKSYATPPLMPRTSWHFAYAIPYFDDTQGATARLWTTGILLNNQAGKPTTGHLDYTIGQNYQQAGQKFTIPFTIQPYAKIRFDLYLGNPAQGIPGLKDTGYPPHLNTEGHLSVFTDQLYLLQPSLLIADTQYDFTVTEDYND